MRTQGENRKIGLKNACVVYQLNVEQLTVTAAKI